MNLAEQIKSDFMIAYKQKDFAKKNSLWLIKSEILSLEKKNGIANKWDIIKFIKKLLKSIEESQNVSYSADLAREKALYKGYIPKQLTGLEINEELDKYPNMNMWEIMKYFKEKFDWRVDNKLVSDLVRQRV